MNDTGFSNLELMLAILLLLVVVGVASPKLQYLFYHLQLTAAEKNLLLGLQYARFEAINRHENIIYCGSSDGINCDGQWSRHQLVVAAATSRVLRIFYGTGKEFQISWHGSLAKSELIFLPTGFTFGQQGSFHIKLQNSTTSAGASVVVLKSGLARKIS